MHERTWACECLRLASNKARRVNTQAPPGVFNRVTRDRLCRRAVARHRPANGAAPCGESWRSAGELASQAQLEASNSSLSKKNREREKEKKKNCYCTVAAAGNGRPHGGCADKRKGSCLQLLGMLSSRSATCLSTSAAACNWSSQRSFCPAGCHYQRNDQTKVLSLIQCLPTRS
jgi:hypothetical protein